MTVMLSRLTEALYLEAEKWARIETGGSVDFSDAQMGVSSRYELPLVSTFQMRVPDLAVRERVFTVTISEVVPR